ncbi:MAG: element excision factor XisI family protein [Saprospiraceae bacterium]|nr:element excision factor XisI family protein [Saprospiraceae bacterium]MDZ4703776.1 element excision factor XisI family protein [Saprospiraceae bacterium]
MANARLAYQVIADAKRNHFQLVRLGWHNHKFNYLVLLHFDLNPETGKIWIQQNNTEWLVADDLEDRGVEQSDIVLGFKPEYIRALGSYAVS